MYKRIIHIVFSTLTFSEAFIAIKHIEQQSMLSYMSLSVDLQLYVVIHFPLLLQQ